MTLSVVTSNGNALRGLHRHLRHKHHN